MKITLGELKKTINEVLTEAPRKKPVRNKETVAKLRARLANERKRRNARKKAQTSKPRKQTPLMLMKKITDALSTLGYKVTSREKNQGAIKAWMSKPDRNEYAHQDMSREDRAKPLESSQDVGKLPKQALEAAGLNVKIIDSHMEDERYETTIRGKGFEVLLPTKFNDMGADVFVAVFAGKYAKDEEMGIDTGDYLDF